MFSSKYVQKFALLIIIARKVYSNYFDGDGGSSTHEIQYEIKKEIDNFVQEVYLPNCNITKLGLTIVQNNGETLYATGFGMANEQKRIPIQSRTPFLLGSVSKVFSATAIVKVLHESFPDLGEAVLDTPVRKLVPSSKFTLNDRFRSEEATFRDLLAHRLCIFRDDLQLIASPFSTTSEIIYRQRYASPVCGIRSEFHYNNQMYVMAGDLVGILAKKPFPEIMNGLLREIGLFDSMLASTVDDLKRMTEKALPYYIKGGKPQMMNLDLLERILLSSPASSMFVTPYDMAKFMLFRLNHGYINGKQVIPKEVMMWLQKPSNLMPMPALKKSEDDVNLMSTYAYGLGLMLGNQDGWEYYHHGGYFPMYRSLFSLYPEQQLGIFTCSNEGPMSLKPGVLHTFIFDLLRGIPNARERAMRKVENAVKKSQKMDAIKEKAFEGFLVNYKCNGENTPATDFIQGRYGSGSSGDVEIVEKFNLKTKEMEAYIKYGKWFQGWLKNIGGPCFEINFETDVVQDNYASGTLDGYKYVVIQDDSIKFLLHGGEALIQIGEFKKNVSLKTLPDVPWSSNECKEKEKLSVDAKQRNYDFLF